MLFSLCMVMLTILYYAYIWICHLSLHLIYHLFVLCTSLVENHTHTHDYSHRNWAVKEINFLKPNLKLFFPCSGRIGEVVFWLTHQGDRSAKEWISAITVSIPDTSTTQVICIFRKNRLKKTSTNKSVKSFVCASRTVRRNVWSSSNGLTRRGTGSCDWKSPTHTEDRVVQCLCWKFDCQGNY